jgi:hypothetical protein
MGTEGYLLWGKVAVAWSSPIHLIPRSRIVELVSSTQYVFMARCLIKWMLQFWHRGTEFSNKSHLHLKHSCLQISPAILFSNMSYSYSSFYFPCKKNPQHKFRSCRKWKLLHHILVWTSPQYRINDLERNTVISFKTHTYK